MAVVITPFPHQYIPQGTPFSLDIHISGNPGNVSVDGPILGFKYHWTGTVIQLRGTPPELANDIPVVVTADDAVFRGTLSVVRIRPIIGGLQRRIIQRGVAISIPIPITGHVSKLLIYGPYIGLHHRKTDTGGELYGTVPADAVFTTREFNFRITAYNGDVFDTETLTLEVALGS